MYNSDCKSSYFNWTYQKKEKFFSRPLWWPQWILETKSWQSGLQFLFSCPQFWFCVWTLSAPSCACRGLCNQRRSSVLLYRIRWPLHCNKTKQNIKQFFRIFSVQTLVCYFQNLMSFFNIYLDIWIPLKVKFLLHILRWWNFLFNLKYM